MRNDLPEESLPKSINQLFSMVSHPPYAEVHAFVIFCIDRVAHLFETDSTKSAFQQLKMAGAVEPELAEQANVDSNSLYLRNSSAAKAVGEAVRHCTRPNSFHFSDNYVENARLVALYCQWALSWAECPLDPDDECDDVDDEEDESGLLWLRRQIEEKVQAEQLAFVFERFPHWIRGTKK